jgi:aspartate aminotransferase
MRLSRLSGRESSISESPTIGLDAKATQLKSQGKDVVSFAVGQPDFDTPDSIKDAAIESIKEGFTKYTAASGIPALKDAIIEKFKKENGIEYKREEIVVSCGAKHSLYNIFLAICSKDDEVIIPAPYWVTYPEQVKLVDGKPIIIQTDESNDFKITPKQFRDALTSKTKAIIINTPNNPTGAVYTRNELSELLDIAIENKIFFISDEVYEHMVYDGNQHFSPASFKPEAKEWVITVNAVSKTYSMTGWRIGYIGGPKDVVSAISKFQSQMTSNPTSISQKASIEALLGDQKVVREMIEEFDVRRKLLLERLSEVKKIRCMIPKGAFYAFPNISDLIGMKYKGETIKSSLDFGEKLIEEKMVVVVPGEAFGAPGYIRLSYATSKEKIEEGVRRIKEFVEQFEE